jgi:hypothetical protein
MPIREQDDAAPESSSSFVEPGDVWAQLNEAERTSTINMLAQMTYSFIVAQAHRPAEHSDAEPDGGQALSGGTPEDLRP